MTAPTRPDVPNHVTREEVSQEMLQRLLDEVDGERLLALTVDLVRLPSPSGSERAVSERYAQALREAGLEVQVDREFPESPSVIGRLHGSGDGPTLQLDGHTDTVSQPHPPLEIREGRIFGRGAADMKAGLAAIAEASRVLASAATDGLRLNGSLLVTAHGQHEDAVSPHELHAPMFSLFRKGILGDAAIIAEGPGHEMVIAGKGLCSFDLTFWREGEPVHEVMWRERVPHPILAGHRFVRLLQEREDEWRSRPDPLLGPETAFVGVFQSGDYFNRIPTACRLAGSRRYPAERAAGDVEAELRALVQSVKDEFGVEAELSLTPSGQGFRIDPAESIVQSVRGAYKRVTGRTMPLAGISLIGNASQFNTIAGVPTVYHGVDQSTAHSGLEHVALSDVIRTAQVLVAAAVSYVGTVSS